MLVGLSVAGETRNGGDYPILQIWRPTGPMSNDYESISEYTFPNVGCTQQPNNVWQCTVSPSIDVEVGDIIGINLPRNHTNFAAFIIYFTPPSSSTSYILGSTTASTFSQYLDLLLPVLNQCLLWTFRNKVLIIILII